MDEKVGKSLVFELVSKCKTTRARSSLIKLSHGTVDGPVFMPVGTQGTLKGLTCQQLRDMDCKIMLGNTYHLGLRPGGDLLNKIGGLHKFMGWDRALLTDSGGFQMVSLLKLARITEDGVMFESPRDGSEMLLTPEKSIELQNAIGADIIMQLDDVVSTVTTGPRVKEAMLRTIRWLDRCILAHQKPNEQALFPIVQGGTDLQLRTECINALVARDMPGYAIGGLSGGEEKDIFWRVVKHCAERLPEDRPIYCMGVGYAVDLVVCVALGVDMFDCVYPSRTARFGTVITRYGNLPIRNSRFQNDMRAIDSNCTCLTCKNYTRAHLHQMAAKETVGCHLLTIHNIHFQLDLMRRVRKSIDNGCFPEFVREFLHDWYSSKDEYEFNDVFNTESDKPKNKKLELSSNGVYPQWVSDALNSVGIQL